MATQSKKQHRQGLGIVPLISPGMRASITLLEELRNREAELKVKDEELRASRQALEDSRDRYLDLYEFAPVGYLRLTSPPLASCLAKSADSYFIGNLAASSRRWRRADTTTCSLR